MSRGLGDVYKRQALYTGAEEGTDLHVPSPSGMLVPDSGYTILEVRRAALQIKRILIIQKGDSHDRQQRHFPG